MIGKPRQTPQRLVTIIRLELSAALVATRLNRMMQHELDVAMDEEFFWTESTCVLSHIGNKEKRLHAFVANRITTIHEGSRPDQWNYVDTGSNSADYVSRDFKLKSSSTKTAGLMALPFCGKKRTTGLSNLKFLWN